VAVRKEPIVGKYAKGTHVPVTKTEAEIKKRITDRGASSVAMATKRLDDGQMFALVIFEIEGKQVRIDMKLPHPDSKEFTQTPQGWERSPQVAYKAWEEEVKRRYRGLKNYIVAQFDAIDSEIVNFETAFLGHLVLPNRQTVAQFMIPQFHAIYEEHEMPDMLPGLESTVKQLPEAKSTKDDDKVIDAEFEVK
jgi:hypothetical protein